MFHVGRVHLSTRPWRAFVPSLVLAGGLAAGIGFSGCSSGGSGGSTSASSSSCSGESVNSFQELLVVDEGVLTDTRASNASDGAWSFRSLVENLAPSGTDPSDFTMTWLTGWVATTTFNGHPLDEPNEDRSASMNTRIICPWLLRTPANNCNADCSTCTDRTLDLAQAPFRLIGIANRMDLRDSTVSEPSGEGRLLFNATDGAGDDPTSQPLPMTIGFEYRLPETRSTAQWAAAWHALGAFTAMDEPYRAALQSVTDSFVTRGSAPAAAGGTALAQVRSNESALDWIWQQRQFELDGTGNLALAPVRNTPAESLNNTQTLADYVTANQSAILANNFEIPVAYLGGSSNTFLFSWQVPGVPEAARHAFALETCDGCHGSEETKTIDTAFHLSPFKSGIDKVSTFLYDRSGSGNDELGSRTDSLRRSLCSN